MNRFFLFTMLLTASAEVPAETDSNIILEKVLEILQGIWEKIKELWEQNCEDIIYKIQNAVVEFFQGIIDEVLGFINFLLMGYGGVSSSFATFQAVLGGIAATALAVVVAYRCAQNMMDMSGGGDYTPFTQIIWETIKSGALFTILPWIMVTISTILPSVITFFAGDAFSGFSLNGWTAFLMVSSSINPQFWMLILLIIVNLVALFFFLFKMCAFHVEMMVLEAYIPLAAISYATKNKEFYENWKNSLFSLLITTVTNIVLFAFMISQTVNLLSADAITASMSSVLSIGAATLLITGPMLMKKYKNGGMMGGLSSAAHTAIMMMPK